MRKNIHRSLKLLLIWSTFVLIYEAKWCIGRPFLWLDFFFSGQLLLQTRHQHPHQVWSHGSNREINSWPTVARKRKWLPKRTILRILVWLPQEKVESEMKKKFWKNVYSRSKNLCQIILIKNEGKNFHRFVFRHIWLLLLQYN